MPENVRGQRMGTNGGIGNTIFADGFTTGLWWWRAGQVVTELFDRLSREQRRELDDEVDRVTALLER